MPDGFYDQLGSGYDAIIDWEKRLAREAPFYRDLFAGRHVQSVLDTACGTGEHAALFASWGLEVVGTDVSEEMLATCQHKYGESGVRWVRAGFGGTHDVLHRTLDAVTCLGNSFPHILTDELAERTAADFARLLDPGGVLVIQQLNYGAMRARNERFLGPESRTVEGRENLFLRLFDLDRNPIRFTIVRLERADAGWTRQSWETEHRAWTAAELTALLTASGFTTVEHFGDFAGSDFDPCDSDQLITVAVRAA